MVTPMWETVWRIPKIFKIELPQDPAIPLLGVYQKGLELGAQRCIYSPMCTAALYTTDKLLETSSISINR